MRQHIIVFNGPPGSGKDEASNFLATNCGFKSLSFKYQLFLETFKLFGVSEEWFMNGYDDRTIKERPEELLGGRSRRQALIYTSEDVLKPKFGKQIFGLQAAKQINLVDNYCFSDCGFAEELLPIINTAGAKNISLVQLFRDGCSFRGDSRRYVNGTNIIDEIVIDHETPINPEEILPEPFDMIQTYRIFNNGSIAEFHQAVKNIYLRGTNIASTNYKKRANIS